MNEKTNKLKKTYLKRRAAYNGDAFGHIDDEGRYISYRAKNTDKPKGMVEKNVKQIAKDAAGSAKKVLTKSLVRKISTSVADDMLDSAKKYKMKTIRRKIK